MNIYQKLSAIQTELKAPKTQFNGFGKYNYRNCEDILEAVKPLLKKYNVAVTLSDDLLLIGDRYYIQATATLYDGAEQGQIMNTAYAREELSKSGMDGSQITGSSSSYARKYALNGLFAIDDTKDSDTTNTGDTQVKHEAKQESKHEAEASGESVINFGKHKGKTIREVYNEAPDYVEWLAENAQKDDIRLAAKQMIGTADSLLPVEDFEEDGLPF